MVKLIFVIWLGPGIYMNMKCIDVFLVGFAISLITGFMSLSHFFLHFGLNLAASRS